MKVGIVGFGFVGKAVYHGFKDYTGEENILVNDVAHPANFDVKIYNIQDIVDNCEIVFVCVPTPTSARTARININIVEGVIGKIDDYAEEFNKHPIVILKSTITPGSCRRLQRYYKNIDLVFNPEFLTEANYIEDFKNQKYVVLGGDALVTNSVFSFYRQNGFPDIAGWCVTWEEAEMTKYIMNCFLASKVALFNEFYRICKAAGINYDMVSELVALDSRIGASHTEVPGHDGEFGFGGKCFPKDLLALIDFAKGRHVNPKILQQIWESNLEFRSDRNWLNIPGAIE